MKRRKSFVCNFGCVFIEAFGVAFVPDLGAQASVHIGLINS